MILLLGSFYQCLRSINGKNGRQAVSGQKTAIQARSQIETPADNQDRGHALLRNNLLQILEI